jgi:DNA-binding NarL/FixJ family response regulator
VPSERPLHRARRDAAAGRADVAHSVVLAAVADACGWIDVCAVLGFIELTADNPATAATWLAPAADALVRRGDARHPALRDAVHAAVETAALDRARGLVAHLERAGGPAAVYARALLDAADGDLDAAREGARGAAAAERASAPFEAARSLLLLGRIERRAKRWRASRDALERAANGFVDAPAWQAKAHAELRRLGVRVADGQLTETQSRIAQLAAAGLSNREIAASVFVSRKTVEANLSHVYRKLGLRSRTQLARRLAPSTP